MSFLDILRALFLKKQNDDGMPYSIVMLFRSPYAISKEKLETAASRAYGLPYDGSQEMYFVMHSPALTIIKAGPMAIKVLESPEPYFEEPNEVAKRFKDPRLGDAWREHRTWVAFDLMNRDVSKRQAYRSLAALVRELVDSRCAGIYFPKDSQFTIQSDGSAAKHLDRLAS